MGKGKGNGKGNGKATMRDGVERARYTRKLPVAIDDAACAEKGKELAKVIHQRDAVLEERRETTAGFRDKLKFFDERLEELANSVEQHTELREVDVVEQLVVETNEIQVVRVDTGEVVETRTAEAEDRQEALGFSARADESPIDVSKMKPGAPAPAKKGTAAQRKKRGGKTTVTPSADAQGAE